MDTNDETITHITSIAYNIWPSTNMIFFLQKTDIQEKDTFANMQ